MSTFHPDSPTKTRERPGGKGLHDAEFIGFCADV